MTFFRVLLIASFAVWFGGFTFYVSIVVPIGTDVLGSPFDQGMITRRVTVWLNWFGVLAWFMMGAESVRGILSRRSRVESQANSGSRWIWTTMICVAVGIACQVVLFGLHPRLDQMIDLQNMVIKEGTNFYRLHQVYLWTITLQWIVAWGWLIGFVVDNFSLNRKGNTTGDGQSQRNGS